MKLNQWIIAVFVIVAAVAVYFLVDIKRLSGNSNSGSSSSNGSGSGSGTGANGGSGTGTGGSGTFNAANARTFANKLYDAMKGWGTDEDAIWAALNNRPQEQRDMIRDSFNQLLAEKHESGDLISWFNDELSGEDLEKALAYFP